MASSMRRKMSKTLERGPPWCLPHREIWRDFCHPVASPEFFGPHCSSRSRFFYSSDCMDLLLSGIVCGWRTARDLRPKNDVRVRRHVLPEIAVHLLGSNGVLCILSCAACILAFKHFALLASRYVMMGELPKQRESRLRAEIAPVSDLSSLGVR